MIVPFNISSVKKQSEVVNTGIPSVDAVLTAKIGRAYDSGITVQYKVLIDGELNINQLDLAIIIASAMDNAIEAIQRSGNVQKNIILKINTVAEQIIIFVENAISEPIDEDFKTSKTDKASHGYGLAQMKAIAQRYSGDIHPDFDITTGRFTLKVLLKNQSI